MLTIYCGDDIVTSRENYFNCRERFIEKGSEIINFNSQSLGEVISGSFNTSLFMDNLVFFGENLFSLKKNRDKLLKATTDIDLVVWEEKYDPRDLKRQFSQAKLIISKLPDNLFTFLDSIIPGRKKSLLESHHRIDETIEPNMLLFMLQKRIKQLIFVSMGNESALKLASWQLSRLKTQSTYWDSQKLLLFYDKLFAIEKNNKTSYGHYSISQSLDILFCYYL